MWEASLIPVAVSELEIQPGEAPAEEYGYKHLFVGVGHLRRFLPFMAEAIAA